MRAILFWTFIAIPAIMLFFLPLGILATMGIGGTFYAVIQDAEALKVVATVACIWAILKFYVSLGAPRTRDVPRYAQRIKDMEDDAYRREIEKLQKRYPSSR